LVADGYNPPPARCGGGTDWPLHERHTL